MYNERLQGADYYDFLAESRLIAIAESEDSRDIRPIAMPELYPKLVGNMLKRMLSAKTKGILGPVQLGCGFQFATEAIIHGVHESLLRPNIDICQFDFRNAFNNADRQVALLNIKEYLPALYPLMTFRRQLQ
jgi:hypothetical protein